MSDERSVAEIQAERLGKQCGTNAAEWAIDPSRMSREQMLAVLKGIEDDDPAVTDQFREPNLSGENQGEPTPQSILEDVGAGDDTDSELIVEAWEGAARDAFWTKIQETLAFHTKED